MGMHLKEKAVWMYCNIGTPGVICDLWTLDSTSRFITEGVIWICCRNSTFYRH